MPEDHVPPTLITRREAIIAVSRALGGVALVGQAAMLAGCEREEAADTPAAAGADVGLFPAADVERLSEIAETILPETDTPGAKAAGTGPFIAMMVTDCYWPAEQRIFTDGLRDIDARAEKSHAAPFLELTPAQRLELVTALDREQYEYMQTRAADAPAHYFRMMKELTLLGFFTSEVGYKQALRYAETPGRYDPCAPYEPGEPAWAPHA